MAEPALPLSDKKSHKKKHKIKDTVEPSTSPTTTTTTTTTTTATAAPDKERNKKKRKISDLTTSSPMPPTAPTIQPPTSQPSTSSSSKPSRRLKSTPTDTPYTLTTASRYLSISPAYSATPLIGIQRDHLDPLVFKYDSTLDGIVLLHQNLRFRSPAAKILGESPFAFVWCLVEFMLWRPAVGMVLEGYVNNVSPSHVGMLCENVFSVAVGGRGIPEGWKFVAADPEEFQDDEVVEEEKEEEEEAGGGKRKKKDGTELIEGLTRAMGRWIDVDGEEVEGMRKFVVTGVKVEGGMLSLEGSFKDEDIPEIVDGDAGVASVEAVGKEVTQLHGKDSDGQEEEDEEESRRRRKERKEKKKRKREGKAD
ncbi:hypothetical protein TWF694_009759 [Orbilia ellipsospora]|uniref:DNA-directed RNA polymerase subunit n=1 Tax=Orbilia ellipsospora TaxID=2528407 RepID=A0AAV9XBS2_9PEZI